MPKKIFQKKIYRLCFILLLILAMCLPASFSPAQNSEEELFFIAQKAFDDGFYDIAIRYIEQFLKQFPQSPKQVRAKLLLGQCYFFQNQYLKAYEIFQGLLAQSEFQDATRFWLGETYLKGSDYRQAEKQYLELIRVFPTSEYLPQAYYSLGWTYFEQQNYEAAQKIFSQLVALFPTHPLKEDAWFKTAESLYHLEKFEEAIQQFKDYLMAFPQSPKLGQAYFYLGESYYFKNDYLTASTYYAKAAEISYDSKIILMAQISSGWSYLKLKRLELAQKAFAQAMERTRQHPDLTDDVLLGEATLYNEMQEYTKANQTYTELIKQFPQTPRVADALLGKANNLYILADYPSALVTYQQIIDKFSTEDSYRELVEKAYFGLAWTFLKSGQMDLAIQNFQNILAKAESKTVKVSAVVQMGDAYQEINQFDKAIEMYDQILRDYPDSLYVDYAQFRQGTALLKMEKIEAAIMSFKTLEANFPKSKYLTDAQYFLGVAYFKKEDWATAQEYIEKYLRQALAPMDTEFLAEAHYILALCAFNRNEPKKSLNIFQKILTDFPTELSIVRNAEKGIAESLFQLGQTAEAIQKFNSIIHAYPDSSLAQESLEWLGDYYFDLPDFAQAIPYYEEFLQRFPQSQKVPLIQYQIAKAYENLGELEKALNYYKLINDPRETELYAKAKLAIAEIFTRDLDAATAIQTYENIILNSPDFKRNAYVKIADIHKGQRDYPSAIQAYQKALEAPIGLSRITNPDLQFAVGDVYELLNQRERAVEEYLKIPYLYPKEIYWAIRAQLRMARIFEDTEQWENAKNIYTKVLEYQTEEAAFAKERLEWIEENVEKARR